MNNKVLYQGAEAKIIKTTYMGFPVVKKQRLQKGYRIPEIDSQLIKNRTKEEAKLLTSARKQGVCVPIMYDINLVDGYIIMEFIEGKRIKDIFNQLSVIDRKKLCKRIGENIAYLHNGNIIHGDLTTSNILLSDNRLYFIDFGLGEINHEVEAKAVDLHVLMEAFESTHSLYSNAFAYVLDGYTNFLQSDATSIKRTIDKIVKRGRYR